MQDKQITKETTLEDLMADPKAYGAPTFEEYKKDPMKYTVDKLAMIDRSTTLLRKNMRRQTYEVFGVRCNTLERATSVAKEHGIVLDNVDPNLWDIQVIPLGGQKHDLHCTYPGKGIQNGTKIFRD